MTTSDQQSPDALCSEILADARREREEILRRAQTEAASILAAAQADAERIRREQEAQAQAEAARRKETILATVAVEIGRLRSARVEALLETVHAEIRRGLLEQNIEARETVVALASEAIGRMPGTHFALKISAADEAAFGGGLAPEIAQRTGRSGLDLAITADGAMASGGVLVQDIAGWFFWDNRLSSRLDRLWPELRRQLAAQTSLADDHDADTVGGTP